MSTRGLVWATLPLSALLVAGCSTGEPGAPAPTATVTVTADPEPQEEAAPDRLADDPASLTCESLITADRFEWLTDAGLVAVEKRDEITDGSLECLWGYPDSRTSPLDYYAYAPITPEYRDEQMALDVNQNTTTHLYDPATDVAYREEQGGITNSVRMTSDELIAVFGYDNLEHVAPLVDAIDR